MQLKKKPRKPSDQTGYKARLKKQAEREKLGDLAFDQAEQPSLTIPVSAPVSQPVNTSGVVGEHRVADNVAFVYFRKTAVEPTILLSTEDDQGLLRLPVFFRRPDRFENSRIGWFVSRIGKAMARRITPGLQIRDVFEHTFCNFFPKGLELHEGQTSAWVVGQLDTGDFDEWHCQFSRGDKGLKSFKSRWCGISELVPEEIRPMHRRVILFSIGTLKRVYDQRFDLQLDAFAERLRAGLV